MSERSLRVGLIAPVAAPVAPGQGDSVEQLVGLLADGLVARGHDVTLYASGDSHTTARLRSVVEHGFNADDRVWDWFRLESFNAGLAFAHADEHDIIHAHNFHFALPFAGLTRTPLVDTAHTEIPHEVLAAYARQLDVHVVTVSEHQRRSLGGRPNASVIPHGIDFSRFPFQRRHDGYLLFLGRMIADKGPAQAIRIARAADMPLILAGPAEEGYDVQDEPGLDGARVRWVGPVDHQERDRLLAGATALLFPLLYPEPFGLVMLEAMACGAPVLATDVGAVSEIVAPGVTGFVASDWRALIDLVPAAAHLDRDRVRAEAASRFDLSRMLDRHEALYDRLARSRR